jgi:hypothetical protein
LPGITNDCDFNHIKTQIFLPSNGYSMVLIRFPRLWRKRLAAHAIPYLHLFWRRARTWLEDDGVISHWRYFSPLPARGGGQSGPGVLTGWRLHEHDSQREGFVFRHCLPWPRLPRLSPLSLISSPIAQSAPSKVNSFSSASVSSSSLLTMTVEVRTKEGPLAIPLLF